MGDLLIMSRQEVLRLEVIQQLQRRELRQDKAAEVLMISIRQVKRLLASYRENGPQGIVSKKRGKPSNNQLSNSLKQCIKTIIRKEYPDFGPTLACEKLREVHHLEVSLSSVRRLMLEDQIWITRENKLKRANQPRYRRAAFGLMVQTMTGLKVEHLDVLFLFMWMMPQASLWDYTLSLMSQLLLTSNSQESIFFSMVSL